MPSFGKQPGLESARAEEHGALRRRGYGQYCAISGALDVLGERWTLLIVRDLFLGPKRYTDLREGLPGIATDLLTARLRTLEGAGLVRRRTLPRPAAATVYELTERGRLLGPVLHGLAQVGLTLLHEVPEDAEVPPERLALALRAAFRPAAAPAHDTTYQLHLDDEPFVVAVRAGELDVGRGRTENADLTLRSGSVTLIRLLQGGTTVDEALAAGRLEVDGPRAALDRFVAAFAWQPAMSAP
jgi:DNA-binding HxlR family transcriptional regulator/putative sterol carrier protein